MIAGYVVHVISAFVDPAMPSPLRREHEAYVEAAMLISRRVFEWLNDCDENYFLHYVRFVLRACGVP